MWRRKQLQKEIQELRNEVFLSKKALNGADDGL